MNRDLEFAARKVIRLCAMLVKCTEILVSHGASQGRRSLARLFDLARPGIYVYRAATATDVQLHSLSDAQDDLAAENDHSPDLSNFIDLTIRWRATAAIRRGIATCQNYCQENIRLARVSIRCEFVIPFLPTLHFFANG